MAETAATGDQAEKSGLRDLKECRPVPLRKTLVLVNNFMVSTVRFMNRFSTLCEEKLQIVSRDITRIETSLAILEAKMNSIPDLPGGPSGPAAAPADASAGKFSRLGFPLAIIFYTGAPSASLRLAAP